MMKTKNPNLWIFPSILFFTAFSIELMENIGQLNFSYQNTFLQTNEVWRILTGHLTHLGWPHFFLNMAGLVLVWSLYGKTFNLRSWAFIFVWCSISTSLGFYLFNPELTSYVGMSGVLHGLIAAASIYSFFQSYRNISKSMPWEDLIIFIGLWGKIIYEQIIGPIPLTESASGTDVVINAHLYGAISGSIYAVAAVFLHGKAKKKKNHGELLTKP